MFKGPVELWVRHPTYDFLEGSSFGNVRTVERYTVDKNGKIHHSPGKVLAPHNKNNGYFEVIFGKDGKQVTKKLHRIIAQCFIPNQNSLPEVNHRDCNPSNNTPSNLEWVSSKYNIEYREKFGISAAEALGRPLWAYNLKTENKSYFTTQREAERKTGVDFRSINQVIKGKRQQAGGYYFTEDENEVTKEKLQAIKDNMYYRGGVIAINLKTQEPSRFKTRTEAAQSLSCNNGHIGDVITGRRKQHKGYWFTYADENAIENARSKFGDAVADQVADLMSEK